MCLTAAQPLTWSQQSHMSGDVRQGGCAAMLPWRVWEGATGMAGARTVLVPPKTHPPTIALLPWCGFGRHDPSGLTHLRVPPPPAMPPHTRVQCKHQLAARLAGVLGRTSVSRVPDYTIAHMLLEHCA